MTLWRLLKVQSELVSLLRGLGITTDVNSHRFRDGDGKENGRRTVLGGRRSAEEGCHDNPSLRTERKRGFET